MQTRTLAIFGITGRTGQAPARAAVARGWSVRGFARSGSTLPAALAPFNIMRGDFTEAARVVDTVSGTEAVCCVVGPRPPYTEACQTGAMVGTGNRTLAFEYVARSFARRQPAAAQDRAEQERLVQESGLDWTLVKPPRLTDGTARRGVTADSALRVGLLSRISRADGATFVLEAIEGAHYLRARVFVRGWRLTSGCR